MMQLFNFLKVPVPTGETKEMTTIESFTVTWGVKEGWSGNKNIFHKVFTSKEDAREFEKQLIASAKFIRAYIETEITKN